VNDQTTIAGRYRIDGRLGVGGMSTVHLAFDVRLERNVAIKLLAEHLADDATFVSRFRREALSAARLVHPNIVQVFDFGFDEHQHQHFIVMEHVPGHSCAELLRDHGHLDLEEAVEIIIQACRGLDYAHRHGVVHRDVKPGNLLVSESDVVKLADFGIARATDQSSITQVGSVLGTAAYLAPEQARGEEAGPRADIYSLGVVAYQLLSGRLPYDASSLSELALKQQREAPQLLDEINPHVPHELARAIAMALALDQSQRMPDALSFAEALKSGGQGIDRLPGVPPPSTTAATRVIRRQGEPTTAATRAVTRNGPGTMPGARPVRRIPPRAYPTGAYAPDPYAQAARERAAGRRFLALVAVLLALVVAVVIGIAIASSTSKTVVQARTTIAKDFQDGYNQLQNLINQYTK
jgi:serine/threonine protein kinase